MSSVALGPLIKRSAQTMVKAEARLLASRFYQAQRMRRNFQKHVKMLTRGKQEHVAIDFGLTDWKRAERNLVNLLSSYAQGHPAYDWIRSLDIAGHTAGILIAFTDPSIRRLEGHLITAGFNRPFTVRNPYSQTVKGIRQTQLKKKTEPYFTLYRERKAALILKAVAGKTEGKVLALAARCLDQEGAMLMDHAKGLCVRGRRNRNGWECGYFQYLPAEITTLPPHIPLGTTHANAFRWATKLFVSHLYEVMCAVELGRRYLPKRCKTIDQHIPPPNMHLVPGMDRITLEPAP